MSLISVGSISLDSNFKLLLIFLNTATTNSSYILFFRYSLPVDLLQAKLELTDLADFPDSDFQRVVCYYVVLGPDLSLQVKQKYKQ
jgi:hypothetical protein